PGRAVSRCLASVPPVVVVRAVVVERGVEVHDDARQHDPLVNHPLAGDARLGCGFDLVDPHGFAVDAAGPVGVDGHGRITRPGPDHDTARCTRVSRVYT